MGRQRFKAADGAGLAYDDEGEGPALLALAGLTRDGRDFDYLARRLQGVRLIRLDSRGRGGSDWTGADSYTVLREAADALALLDHLQIGQAAIIGSSRGGLLGMLMAAQAPERVTGLCLNDIGPVIERAGLERIGAYVGIAPAAATLDEIAARLPFAMPGFDNVPEGRWREEADRHFRQTADGVALTYDPDLRLSFEASMAGPPADAWPLFEACAGLPLALIRGASSDILSRATADEMQARRPDLMRAEVPGRGHIPFLDEPEAFAVIGDWLRRCFPDHGPPRG